MLLCSRQHCISAVSNADAVLQFLVQIQHCAVSVNDVKGTDVIFASTVSRTGQITQVSRPQFVSFLSFLFDEYYMYPVWQHLDLPVPWEDDG